jgi:hypothetical protein
VARHFGQVHRKLGSLGSAMCPHPRQRNHFPSNLSFMAFRLPFLTQCGHVIVSIMEKDVILIPIRSPFSAGTAVRCGPHEGDVLLCCASSPEAKAT